MGKIRILFTIPNFDTAGSGKALLNIATRLNKDVFEPHIACLNDNGAFFEKVRASGIPYHLIPLYSSPRPIGKLVGEVWKVSKLIKAINPDVVHSYHYSADYTEAMATRLAGKKWTFTKKNMSWGGSSARSWKVRSMLANRIAVQNTDMIKDFYPGSKKTDLIPRGVNTTEFYPRPIVAGLKEQWGIKPEERVILCVANLVPVKGIEVLIDAFRKVIQQGGDSTLKLLIVGDNNNDYGKKLMALTSEMELSDMVIFTGKQQNVSDYHTIADLFVLPTLNEGRREGSPVALLEALACGTISIASDVPGVRDQLSSFPQLKFAAGNAEDLAAKLRGVLAMSHVEQQELKRELTKMVKENYRIENEVANHERFYLETLGRRK